MTKITRESNELINNLHLQQQQAHVSAVDHAVEIKVAIPTGP